MKGRLFIKSRVEWEYKRQERKIRSKGNPKLSQRIKGEDQILKVGSGRFELPTSTMST